MNDCIFCKIAKGDVPSHKVYEDGKFICIVDAFPNLLGQLVILSKEHAPSKFTQIPEGLLSEGMLVARKTALAMEKGLDLERAVEVIEGLAVDHMHIKLFPVYKGKDFDLVSLEKKYPRRSEFISEQEGKDIVEKVKKYL
jgi:histidine triad (HIT) family protein